MDNAEIRKRNLILLSTRCREGRRELAERIGTGYNYLGQVLAPNAKRNVGNDLARKTEEAFDLPFGWMDQIHHTDPNEFRTQKNNMDDLLDSVRGAPTDYDVKSVPELDVTAGLGPGNEIINGEVIRNWDIEKEELIAEGVDPENAVLIRGSGRSMEPTIYDNDLLLVDTAPIQRFEGRVYVIDTMAGIKIKRLHQRSDGTVDIISDSQDKDNFPTESYSAEDFDNLIQVLGVIVYKYRGRVV